MPEVDFYGWAHTFSYDARLNMIITSRGRGKTYGLRKQFVKDYLDAKWRFVEVVRYDVEIPDVCDGYFDKLIENNEYPGYMFRSEGGKKTGKFYIAKCVEDDEKPKWELIGYCVSLNSQQKKDYYKDYYRNYNRRKRKRPLHTSNECCSMNSY